MQALKQAGEQQQQLVENADAVAASASGAAGVSSISRPPLVTRHAPNQQLPAQPALEQQPAALQQQPSQVCPKPAIGIYH